MEGRGASRSGNVHRGHWGVPTLRSGDLHRGDDALEFLLDDICPTGLGFERPAQTWAQVLDKPSAHAQHNRKHSVTYAYSSPNKAHDIKRLQHLGAPIA